MTMNKSHFNEHKQDIWKRDWLVGHIISISRCNKKSSKTQGGFIRNYLIDAPPVFMVQTNHLSGVQILENIMTRKGCNFTGEEHKS